MKTHLKNTVALFVLAVIIITQFATPPSVYAANFSVNNAATLIAAINAANANGQNDVVTLTADIALTAADNGINGLPVILADGGNSMTIEGNGHILSRGGSAPNFRIFEVATGANLILNNLGVTGGNSGGSGGGAISINNGASVTLSNSTLSNNTSSAGFAGGAIYNAGTMNITGSTFSGNSGTGSSSDAGAIFSSGAVNISNSTFFGNTAATDGSGGTGGAIRLEGGPGPNIITHVTFSNNANDTPYGALDINNTTATVSFSVLANTGTGADCSVRGSGSLNSTNNLIENDSGSFPCSYWITGDPGLGVLGNNGGPTQTMAITAASPAYNFSLQPATSCPLSTDQRGVSRPQPTGCDIGAYELDSTAPTVTIVSVSPNPTNAGTTVTWNATENGTYSVRVGGTSCTNGTVVAAGTYISSPNNIASVIASGDLAAGLNALHVCVTDAAANTGSATSSVTKDTTSPTVTITSTATNPTNTSPIPVAITFSEAVSGFLLSEITVGNGTASNFNTTDNITYTVDITPAAIGVVTVDVPANIAQDTSGNGNSAAVQFSVTYDSANPIVASTGLTVSYTGTGPGNFTVTFNKAVDDPAGNTGTDDVTNPANYLLVNKGANGTVNTLSCSGGVVADDTQVTVTSVSYNAATFTSTVTLASTLPVGSYRLFVCGTTSIVDLVGNPLNGGTDYTFDFAVQSALQPSARATSTSLPATGFPMNQVTKLSSQPAKLAYSSTDLWLEIPKLGVMTTIVGVPSTSQGWDVTWLGKHAGWLDGSAFPTWSGNSVITAHVWDALNRPGPFVNLKTLKYGDQIKIHAFGLIYIYEIRESTIISPNNVSAMLKHEEKSWITLITCEDYKELSQTYSSRRMVRAVLVKVMKEN